MSLLHSNQINVQLHAPVCTSPIEFATKSSAWEGLPGIFPCPILNLIALLRNRFPGKIPCNASREASRLRVAYQVHNVLLCHITANKRKKNRLARVTLISPLSFAFRVKLRFRWETPQAVVKIDCLCERKIRFPLKRINTTYSLQKVIQ